MDDVNIRLNLEVDSHNLDCEAECDHLEDVQTDLPTSTPRNQSLQGVWKDVGFEKIMDLEDEIYRIRQELQESILKQEL